MHTEQRDHLAYLADCDVAWNQPGGSAKRSMPIGNGQLGANVWVEKPSSVVILLGHTDAWGEMGPLLKLGRVRVRFDKDVFFTPQRFAQRSDIRNGAICIETVADDHAIRLRLWADAKQPVIWVEVDADAPIEATVELELWRNSPAADRTVSARTLWDLELYSFPLYQESQPFSRVPDHIVPDEPDRITWYHRNEQSIFDLTLRHQGLGDLSGVVPDPLLGRTFGGCIIGQGLVRSGPGALRSDRPFRRLAFGIHCHSAVTANAQTWINGLCDGVTSTATSSLDATWSVHRAWWEQFWKRSWIIVTGDEDARRITRCYALHRYLTACAGRGSFPIKFNGSIFTVDALNRFGKPEGSDFRCWGAMYWLQNTRFIYWPMLASGDFEMMRPLFRMVTDALPLLRYRTRTYFSHGGAILPECMYTWGLYPNASYGENVPGKPLGQVQNPYFRNHFQGSLEIAVMMVEYYRHTADDAFLRDTLLPFAGEVLTFYTEHFSRDEHGRLLLSHINALETFFDVTNPAQDIAGLCCLLDRLLEIGHPDIEPYRPAWQALREIIPPIPVSGQGAERVIALGEIVHDPTPHNIEVPELWTIFPFGAFGVGRDELELATNTFRHRRIRRHECWHHDDLIAARLGLREEAARMLSERFDPAVHTEPACFPVFWSAHNDWMPDMDHGGAGMMALQSMVLQWYEDERLWLMPAWPKRWSLDFRLHAPGQTVVEGHVRDGRVQFRCAPPDRNADVILVHDDEPARMVRDPAYKEV